MFKKIALFKNSMKVRREVRELERKLKKMKAKLSRNVAQGANDTLQEVIKSFENEIFRLRACI